MQPEWVSEKNHTTSPNTKSRNLSTNEITQPVHQKRRSNLSTKKSCKLSTQKDPSKNITQSLRKKKSCNLQKIKSCNLSDWVRKSHNLSTHKNHATSPHTKFHNLFKKHYENRKTLRWEHRIHCQMCQITLSKKTFSAFLERAIWHIWQPMWCSQGSFLRFLRFFWGGFLIFLVMVFPKLSLFFLFFSSLCFSSFRFFQDFLIYLVFFGIAAIICTPQEV